MLFRSLPSRLASLAVRPPFTTCLVARQEEIAGVESRSPPSRIKLWHVLIELAKSGSQIALQTISGESTFEERPTSPSSVDHDDWLPELLISPPRREQEWLFRELRLATHSDVCGKVVSQSDATAVFAGLWLLHGDADASHRQSQSIEDEGRHRCGNFWHAIMHRQEPDYGNSKYWFRRVGQHPIFPELARRADELTKADGSEAAWHWRRNLGLPDRWDPFAFVDWCESAASDGGSALASLARRIQFVEMRLLLRASFEDAVAAGR